MTKTTTRLLLIVSLLLFGACEDVLEPPASAKAQRDLDDLPTGRVTVELTRYGTIKFGGKAVNLDQLGAALKVKAAGSGWEKLAGGAKASKLFLMIRADRQAPWQHVQWLLTEAAMNKYYKIYFVVTRPDGKPGRVQAFLPTDKGIIRRAANAEIPNELIVTVHVVARRETLQKRAGMQVAVPTEFRYKFGDRESADVKSVAKWVGDANKAAKGVKNAYVAAEIKAGHKVPFQKVVEVMNVLRATGQEQIDFFGTQITHGKLRKKMQLPYPSSNYGRTK